MALRRSGLCRLFLVLLTTSQWTALVQGKEVCYNNLGCFSNDPPFDNADGALPESPKEMGVKHHVYSRQNQLTPVSITSDDPESVSKATTLDPTRPLKVITHGFSDSISVEWMQTLKDEILKVDDANVYLVGWSNGAKAPFYYQAVSNLRVVAAEVKAILTQFVAQGLRLDDVHVMGMSLGAHLVGEVGRLTAGQIGRITGMDPASPGFEGLNVDVRLDKSDAKFVDVIHTDGEKGGADDGVWNKLAGGGFGSFLPSGHVDIYVNGGQDQPGCNDGIVGLVQSWLGWRKKRGLAALAGKVSCSHGRICSLFIESVSSPCSFTAYPCDSYAKFKAGQCLDCSGGGCNVMGYHSNATAGRGKLYLNTFGKKPFCGYHYSVALTPFSDAKGTLKVAVGGQRTRTDLVNLTPEAVDIEKDSPVRGLVLGHADVGPVTSLDVRYERYGWFDERQVTMSRAEVKSGVTGKGYAYCSGPTTVPNKVTKTITGLRARSC
ncbi:pancreatic lipase-related protein 2 [Aplysia californica]|uniref:Pancreatic lipase-related protein 2 n=1 Tax=Aplysia californica TaxID=6500 RepID=A0ABM1ADE5_APLCA|nr:pancreatic lipase-related protein 2 [Aplysia californica]